MINGMIKFDFDIVDFPFRDGDVPRWVLGHFGHGHFGHGRFGQDISATDISANGHFGHGHFGHGKNTNFLLLQMEFNRFLPFKINMFDHYKLTQ